MLQALPMHVVLWLHPPTPLPPGGLSDRSAKS